MKMDICPICGEKMKNGVCESCGYTYDDSEISNADAYGKQKFTVTFTEDSYNEDREEHNQYKEEQKGTENDNSYVANKDKDNVKGMLFAKIVVCLIFVVVAFGSPIFSALAIIGISRSKIPELKKLIPIAIISSIIGAIVKVNYR